MEPLNLLRHATRFYQKDDLTNETPGNRAYVLGQLTALKQAMKFVLPEGGLYMENDDLPSIIRLPYPLVILEFNTGDENLNPETYTQCLIVASENKHSSTVIVRVLFRNRKHGFIESKLAAQIPMLSTNDNDDLDDFITIGEFPEDFGITGENIVLEDENYIRHASRCLINFMLFLDMTNVFSEIGKNKVKKGEKLTAHLHDSYHVLKVRHHKTGKVEELTYERVSRSPRQHYRRVHLRRRKFSQERIYINPVIVNKGWKGKVSKDYELCQNQGRGSEEEILRETQKDNSCLV